MTDYKGVLAALRAQRVAIDQEREKLNVAISAIEALMPKASQASHVGVGGDDRVSPRAFKNLFMPNAIYRYLTMVQELKLKKEIQEALLAGGMKETQSFSAHVYNTLHRLSKGDGPFVRHDQGRWGLREWTKDQQQAG